jgi:hypothetical protein
MKRALCLLTICALSAYAMEKSQLIRLAYGNKAQDLEKVISPDLVNSRDEMGYCLLAYSIAGSYVLKNMTDFKNTIDVYKKNNIDLHAPAKTRLDLNCLLFAATLGVKHNNFDPVKILIQAGADPNKLSDDEYSVYAACIEKVNESLI